MSSNLRRITQANDESGIGNLKGIIVAQYNTKDMVKFRIGSKEAVGEILDIINPSAPFNDQGPIWYLIKRTDKEHDSPISVHESNVLQKVKEA